MFSSLPIESTFNKVTSKHLGLIGLGALFLMPDTFRTHPKKHPKVHQHPESYRNYAFKKNLKDNTLLATKGAILFGMWNRFNTPMKTLGVGAVALDIMHRNKESYHMTPGANLVSTTAVGVGAAFLASNPTIQNAVKGSTLRGIEALRSYVNLNGKASQSINKLAQMIKSKPGTIPFSLVLPVATTLAGKLYSHPKKEVSPSRYTQPQNIAGDQSEKAPGSIAVKHNMFDADVNINSRIY